MEISIFVLVFPKWRRNRLEREREIEENRSGGRVYLQMASQLWDFNSLLLPPPESSWFDWPGAKILPHHIQKLGDFVIIFERMSERRPKIQRRQLKICMYEMAALFSNNIWLFCVVLMWTFVGRNFFLSRVTFISFPNLTRSVVNVDNSFYQIALLSTCWRFVYNFVPCDLQI